MSKLYLYAVLADRPRRRLGRGLRGEPVRAVSAGGLVIAAGAMARPPRVSLRAVEAHDATVRRLAALTPAALPMRFGTLVADAAELDRRLARRTGPLRQALALVAGREQMTLLIARAEGRAPARPRDARRPGGPGARYLARLARDQAAPDWGPLRAALAPLVRVEQVAPAAHTPGGARVHHLVDRGRSAVYRTLAEEAARALPGIRVTVIGPSAPYAFAPRSWR
jgi:hypothetical protein